MQHLAAYHENIDAAGALVELTAVNDPAIFTLGDDVRIPSDVPFMIGVAACIEATLATRVQVTSPSLKRLASIDVSPFDTGLVIDSGHKVNMFPMSPVALKGGEALNLLHQNNPAAATDQYGLVWLSDGPQPPVAGDIFTIRAEMSVTAVLGSWVNGGLTFDTDLPVGVYDVVGMRCVEPTTVAARLVFPGGAFRPGVQGLGTEGTDDNEHHRMGKSGVWGQFETNTPPTVDILAAAGAITPVVYLDVIARG